MILDSNLISIDRQYLSTTSTVTGIPVPLTGFKDPGRQGPIQVCIFISESVSWDIRFNIYQSNSPDGPWKRCATRTVHVPKRGRFLAWRFLPRSVKKQWLYFEAIVDPEDREWPELPNTPAPPEIQTVQVFAAITIEDLRWYEDGLFIDWHSGTSDVIRPPEGETPPEDLPEIEESEEGGVRLLIIMPSTGEEEEDEEIEDFEVEETGHPDEDVEQNELEEEGEYSESSGVYRGLVIGKSEAEGGDDKEEVEGFECVCDEDLKPHGKWWILCCGYICGDTIGTCGDGYIQMGSCPWLCLHNSYVCNSGSCGSCGTCGGAFAITCGCFDSNCSCLISNCAASYGGGMYLSCSCATICDSYFCSNCAGTYGGGMYLQYSFCATICDSCFCSNCADCGGGMYLHYSCATICDSYFCSNCAARLGGGMFLECSCATICDSCFDSNCAYYGGGMYLSYSCATICDSYFCSNCAACCVERATPSAEQKIAPGQKVILLIPRAALFVRAVISNIPPESTVISMPVQTSS